MSLTRHQNEPVPPARARFEAAAWIARLKNEQRSPGLEADFQAWLRESDEHRLAYGRMTRAWDLAGEIRMGPGNDVSAGRKLRRSRFSPWVATLAATLLLVAI